MEEPGGEMEASDRRLCCEVQTKRRRRGEGAHGEKMTVFILFEHCHFKIHLTLSLLSALAACLHNGCHTSHPEEERDRERSVLGVPTCHAFVYTGMYSVCACVCVVVFDVSSFTCQVHFLSLFEHHVTARASSAGRMVVFPSRLRGGKKRRRGVTEHKLSS